MADNAELERWRGATDARLEDIRDRIGEIAASIDNGFKLTAASLASHVNDDRASHKELHGRITEVKGSHDRLLGKIIAIAAVLSLIGGAIAQAVARRLIG